MSENPYCSTTVMHGLKKKKIFSEVCELVGLYLLRKLAPLIGTKNSGFYRDDGLAVIHQPSGPKMDKISKDIIALFKSEERSITIDTNLIETDFLDVSINQEMEKFCPYRKPNNTPLYIHSESNHPPSITKQLPSMTNRLIIILSCNENKFNKAKPLYESALKNSWFIYSMKFEAPVENTRWNRNRKVIWFNPPFGLNGKTNIDKVFLKLVRKHFPRSHNFNKIFNLKTIEISYSSMPNIKNLIKQHDSKILNNDQDHFLVVITTAQLHSTKSKLRFCTDSKPAWGVLEICYGANLWQWSRLEIRRKRLSSVNHTTNTIHHHHYRSCNCRVKESCPLNGKCLQQCIVYKAVVITNTTYNEYYGTSATEFKSRYNNDTKSFRHIFHINGTELSKYLWTLKANGADYHLKWSIKLYASRYKCSTRRCDLCLTEKLIIALADPDVLLNKRTELIW